MVNLLRVTERDVEEAEQEMLRLRRTWEQQGFVVIDQSMLEEQARKANQLATLHGEWSKERERRSREVVRHQQQMQSLQDSLTATHRWSNPITTVSVSIVVGFVSLCLLVLFGICAGIGDRASCGLIVGFVLCCLSIPSTVIWCVHRKVRAEQQVPYLSDELNRVATEGPGFHSQLAAATTTLKEIERLWNQEDDRYQRLVRLTSLKTGYLKAKERYDCLVATVNSRQWQLFHTNWRDLRSVEFETFLQEVFILHGYEASLTKASGDKGIDIILTGKGRRIGIQCKGYGDKVSVASVQEAFTGGRYYRCDTCVVITNSEFTTPAQELASSVGCTLICGRQIPDLIQGKISL
jgi:hypothetical protein